jgi:hypothetical protein
VNEKAIDVAKSTSRGIDERGARIARLRRSPEP